MDMRFIQYYVVFALMIIVLFVTLSLPPISTGGMRNVGGGVLYHWYYGE